MSFAIKLAAPTGWKYEPPPRYVDNPSAMEAALAAFECWDLPRVRLDPSRWGRGSIAQTWAEVKAANGWEQKPGESAREMEQRYGGAITDDGNSLVGIHDDRTVG